MPEEVYGTFYVKMITCPKCRSKIPDEQKKQCPICALWEKRAAMNKTKVHKGRIVIENHNFYYIGGGPAGVKGHGGQSFFVTFKGKKDPVWTDDLWSKGGIPRAWWKKLPDNAKIRKMA